MATILLNNVSANTNGTAVASDGSEKSLLVQAGTWGGAKVKIQVSKDQSTWIDLMENHVSYIYTFNEFMEIYRVGQGLWIRAIVYDTTGTTSNVFVGMYQ